MVYWTVSVLGYAPSGPSTLNKVLICMHVSIRLTFCWSYICWTLCSSCWFICYSVNFCIIPFLCSTQYAVIPAAHSSSRTGIAMTYPFTDSAHIHTNTMFRQFHHVNMSLHKLYFFQCELPVTHGGMYNVILLSFLSWSDKPTEQEIHSDSDGDAISHEVTSTKPSEAENDKKWDNFVFFPFY